MRLMEIGDRERRWIVSRPDALSKYDPIDRPYSGLATVARIDASSAPQGTYVWSSVTPIPVYEVDLYSDGLWASTFAIWPGDAPPRNANVHLWESDRTERDALVTNLKMVHL
jgi:hypothetical protein